MVKYRWQVGIGGVAAQHGIMKAILKRKGNKQFGNGACLLAFNLGDGWMTTKY